MNVFLNVLDSLMKSNGLNKHTLSIKSGIPYTTIDVFYKRGTANARLSTLKRLAEFFDVSLDYLVNGEIYSITGHERLVIEAYRNKPDLQIAIDRILCITDSIPEES